MPRYTLTFTLKVDDDFRISDVDDVAIGDMLIALPGVVEIASAGPELQLTQEQRAYDLGREHAVKAASKIVDGSTPWRPDLSGEWANQYTPVTLYEHITGESLGALVALDAVEVLCAICDAYEEGVADYFEPECERALARGAEFTTVDAARDYLHSRGERFSAVPARQRKAGFKHYSITAMQCFTDAQLVEWANNEREFASI